MFETVQSQCRLVDRVTVKGSQQPVSLYTYDVPDIQSLGGILPDDMRMADPSLSTKAFFRSVVPPATTFEFRRLYNAGLQFARLMFVGMVDCRQIELAAAKILQSASDGGVKKFYERLMGVRPGGPNPSRRP
jgi:hypothetical protein